MPEERRIRQYLKDRFRHYDDSLARADDLTTIVDSLGMFELVEFVEAEFGVSVPAHEFSPARFSSIDSILRLVDELRSDGVTPLR